MPTHNRTRILYSLAAGASLVALISGLRSGVLWSRLGVWLVLAAFFALMALFPATNQRPPWVRWASAGLLLLSLALLVVRLL